MHERAVRREAERQAVIEAVLALTCAAFGWLIGRRFGHRVIEHEPRATRLRLPDPDAHACRYEAVKHGDSIMTLCVTCRRPPPTLMPGPGVSCSR